LIPDRPGRHRLAIRVLDADRALAAAAPPAFPDIIACPVSGRICGIELGVPALEEVPWADRCRAQAA